MKDCSEARTVKTLKNSEKASANIKAFRGKEYSPYTFTSNTATQIIRIFRVLQFFKVAIEVARFLDSLCSDQVLGFNYGVYVEHVLIL